MKRKLVTALILISVFGTFGLMAALHHGLVLIAQSKTFSNAFAATCSTCHGVKQSKFGRNQPDYRGDIS